MCKSSLHRNPWYAGYALYSSWLAFIWRHFSWFVLGLWTLSVFRNCYLVNSLVFLLEMGIKRETTKLFFLVVGWQLIVAGKCQKFDYGTKGNRQHYSQVCYVAVLFIKTFRPCLHGSGQIFARTKTCTVPPCVYTGPAKLDEFLNG